mmetsp:Transcript_85424/g.219944  ORF Transcript_85424/g.219944 Transcript_85424/m.219944 type:complete len:450 (+) Transcript_85424:74-1423(+)
MAMAKSMEDLRAPAPTWAHSIKAYETQKRHVVDQGLVSGQQVRMVPGQVQQQERQFDPLLQRFRDNGTEADRRLHEERNRVAHLNRAKDIQIMREQPFNVVNHTSHLEALAPGVDPCRTHKTRATHGRADMPDTAADFNIISNIGHDKHHWARPEDRPVCHSREPRQRTVPTFINKDFDIVTNKYMDNHDDRIQTEKRLRLLEATQKHMKQNKFDPLTQAFQDPRHEECVRAAEHAREAEFNLRAEHQMPPAYKGRQTNFYDMVNHKVHDPQMIKVWEQQEDARNTRYKNRHIVEHNFHVQDLKHDHVTNARRIQRIAPERFEEQRNRGYDIIDGKAHGSGPKERVLHAPMVRDRMTPWEKANTQASLAAGAPDGTAAFAKTLSKVASAPQLRSSAASVRSGRSNASRASGTSSQARMVTTIRAEAPRPPPAPAIPGSDGGSVFSRARA